MICEQATLKALLDNDWQFPEEIEGETSKYKIQNALFALCDPLEAEGKRDLAEVVGLIAHVAGMSLRILDASNPLRAARESDDGDRTVNPDDLTAPHLEILKEAARRAKNLFLVARINDILWMKIRTPDRTYAELAVKAYLNLSLLHLSESSKIVDARSYSMRAIQLWKQLGSNPDMRMELENTLIKCMALEKPEPPNFVRYFFFEHLTHCFDPSDSGKWLDLGKHLAKESLIQKNYEKARKYTEQMGEIYRAIKDKDNALKMQQEQTALFAQEARDLRAAGADAMILQHRYNRAIEASRNTPGMAADAKALLNEMAEIQKQIPGNLKEISASVDLKPAIEQTIEAIRKQSFDNGLKIIAWKAAPVKKSELYEEAQRNIKDHPLQAFIQNVILDEKGKVIARRPGMGTTAAEKDAVIRSQASQNFLLSVTIKGTIIRWAQKELNNRPDFDVTIIEGLLYPNPFVLESRILQFKKGLLNGLKGDWISAIYILVPLLENSLRHLMQISGHDMIKLDSDGIQQEKDLSSFIYSDEFKEIVGEDLAFQLQVLLTDKSGLNLRNQVAHGLLTDGTALSDVGPFIWSLTLLLCIHFQQQFYRGNQSGDATPNQS